jgi:hypothetical protein
VLAVEPPLGHLLLSAVELAAETGAMPENRPLTAAALRQVAMATEGVGARRLVPLRVGRGWLRALALCTAALLPAAAGSPELLLNALARLALPQGSVPRLTRVQWLKVPAMAVVPQGEPSRLWLRVGTRQGPRPRAVWWRLDAGGRGKARVAPDGRCQVGLPPLSAPAALALRCGDVAAKVNILPGSRPELVSLEAVIARGTRRGEARTKLLPGALRLRVPVGRSVRLEGRADRPLADVRVWSEGGTAVPVTRPAADRFAAVLGPVAVRAEWRLLWSATDGLWARGPLCLPLEVAPDASPDLRWAGEAPPLSALPTAALRTRIEAVDDEGLSSLELRLSGPGGLLLSQSADCGADPTQTAVELSFCPADLGLRPGQTVRLEAAAADGNDARGPAHLAADINLVAESRWLDDAAGRLRHAWQQLAQIAAEESRQADADEQALAPGAHAAADQYLAASRRVAVADLSRLDELRAEASRAIEAGLATEGLDLGVAAAWTDSERALADLAERAFPDLLRALSPAESAEVTAADCLRHAVPLRRDLVRALEAILAGADAFRRCAVRTAALRFLEAARAEAALAADLNRLPDEWAGQDRDRLLREAAALLDALAVRQQEVAAELRELQALLHDLASAGAPDAYALVAQSLAGSGLAADMDRAAAQLRRNHRFFALSTAEDAATRLAELAAALLDGSTGDGAPSGSGQGGGAPGGVGDVAVRIRRLLLWQESLRERTRLAAQAPCPVGARHELAAPLSERQEQLAAAVPEIGGVSPGPLGAWLELAATAMRQAATAIREEHFAPGQAAQAAAVEWLQACLQPGRDGNGAGSGSSAAAADAPLAVALGQTGARPPAEAPLPPAEPAGVTTEWRLPEKSRTEQPLRSASPEAVPGEYRPLWEKYRRRLEEGPHAQ